MLSIKKSRLMSMIFILVGLLMTTRIYAAESATFQQGLDALAQNTFEQVDSGVGLIAQSGDERASQVLNLLLNGDLYVQKKTDALVTVRDKQGSKSDIVALFAPQQAQAETVSSRSIRKIAINNQLRGLLRSELASLNLSHRDPDVRADAVKQLLGTLDAEMYQRLQTRLTVEGDEAIQDLLRVALAIYDVKNSADGARQSTAISTLGESYQPEARIALNAFVAEPHSDALLSEANKALGMIAQRASLAEMSETLFFGLSLGSVLVLSAIGLAITFGVMGVINMAHGELMMLGAYTTYVVQTLMPDHIGWSLVVSIPLAFLVAGAAGILIERSVIRFLYGRPLETLLATFGISLILQQTVRTIFSPLNRSVATPEWMQGVIEINPLLSLTLNRLYIIGFCLAVFALLFMALCYTRLGIEVRAVSQNRSMARAMGVRSDWVDAMTFGLGSGIAGIAGVALSQLTNVGPNLGQSYIIDSFMVVVFGGVGNLWGTLVAGMSLGIVNKVLEPWAGAVLAKILVLVFIILFIQKKPRGLFPQKGRSAEG